MATTQVMIQADEPRARVDLVAGTIVPRLVERGPRSARIALVAGGALLLGGDRIDIAVTIGADCTLDLEDIGGTVAYPSDGAASFWDVEIMLGTDARLRWAGLPLVIADRADVHRHMRLRLGDGAIALVRESVVLGRSGERGGRVRIRTSIADTGGGVLEESLEADGAHPVPGVLGAHRVFDTVIRVGDRPERPSAPDLTLLTLSEPGAVARFLGDAAHASPLAAVWDQWADLPTATVSHRISGPHPLAAPRRAH